LEQVCKYDQEIRKVWEECWPQIYSWGSFLNDPGLAGDTDALLLLLLGEIYPQCLASIHGLIQPLTSRQPLVLDQVQVYTPMNSNVLTGLLETPKHITPQEIFSLSFQLQSFYSSRWKMG
jgi:hypothetical protein